MPLPDEFVLQTGTSIAFGVSGSFLPADAGTQSAASITSGATLTLAGLVDGAGRQSAKIDLGANRAPLYAVIGCVDFTGETPSAPGRVDYFWLPSNQSVAGEGNIAGNSGSDAAAPDGALGSITLAEFKEMGIFIGSLVTHDGASVQNGYVGTFSPPTRYGQLLVINESGDNFEADDVEMHQVLDPIVERVID